MFTQEDVKSAIIGFAVADAFGVPGEFIPREKLQENPITEMAGYGSHDVPAGSWSDDTSMTLCTVESIAEKRGIDLDDIMQRFCRWVDEGYMTPQGRIFDIGRTCMHAIGGYQRGQDVYHCGGGREYDNGNGSLMRILPVCFYNLAVDASPADGFETIYRVSALTHAHDRACLACAIYCEYLKALLFFPAESKPTPVECVKRFEDKPQFEHFKRLASHDFGDLPMEEIRSSGYSVDSLEAAIWCFLNTDSYQDCVIKATNLGQDTDTIAALAGGLAGAFYGYDAIPAQWVDTLIRKDEILTLCDNFYATLKDLHDETEATQKEGNWAVVAFGDGYRRSMPVRKLAMAFERALELEQLCIKSGETAARAEIMYALDIIRIYNNNGYEAGEEELQRLTDYYRDVVTHPRIGDPRGEQPSQCRKCKLFVEDMQSCTRFPKRIPKEIFWGEHPCEGKK
ncbi:MAG: ADP-ribosylglycohydrolase family protein [Clostridia bacterium]|nr:ADP-ribosylglycohydrolase family protein [Clostridia bacterium]